MWNFWSARKPTMVCKQGSQSLCWPWSCYFLPHEDDSAQDHCHHSDSTLTLQHKQQCPVFAHH
jgi:hypothetical protein